ncbi:MAG TPA: glycosyltransferase family 2 protein [Opitutaceae bacterium]|nr:glycosyltransferase family 2 protein [Opitutaceae bacterium]
MMTLPCIAEEKPNDEEETRPICFSLGIMAWNEEESIRQALVSLFQQSVFQKLALRHERCELFCIANGCTDRTAALASELFRQLKRRHPYAQVITTHVVDIPEPGRNNAWNRFVHEFSAPETRFIYLMDADIIFHHRDTLYNLLATLEQAPRACVSSGRQHKSIEFKKKKTLRDRLSLATSSMTGTIEGRISGQLYCMRACIARNLYLPRDLSANDDGFFKAAICTDFFNENLDAGRVVTALDAAHVYDAYLSMPEVLNNQKRQMIGQTSVHVLVEYLKNLPQEERANLAELLRQRERSDPEWLRKLLNQHLAHVRFFWRLFPGILTFRFRRLWKLKGMRKLSHLPAAILGLVVTLIACARAFQFLKKGRSYYWPKAGRQTMPNSYMQSAK